MQNFNNLGKGRCFLTNTSSKKLSMETRFLIDGYVIRQRWTVYTASLVGFSATDSANHTRWHGLWELRTGGVFQGKSKTTNTVVLIWLHFAYDTW